MIQSKDELAESEELCNFCPCTDYGTGSVGTSQYNMCEGMCCDEAYENYLESIE